MLLFFTGLALGFCVGVVIGALTLKSEPEPRHNTDQHTSPRDELDEFLDGELGRKKHNTSTMWGDD